MKTPKNSKASDRGMIDHLSPAQKTEIEKDFFAPGTQNLDLDEILKQNQEKIEKIKKAS